MNQVYGQVDMVTGRFNDR